MVSWIAINQLSRNVTWNGGFSSYKTIVIIIKFNYSICNFKSIYIDIRENSS